jgi:hypothetical protein
MDQHDPAPEAALDDGAKRWESLSSAERETFLLAAFCGSEAWQSVANHLGLDPVLALRLATSLCHLASPPKSEDERLKREHAALLFHGRRPLGLALIAAISCRDGIPLPRELDTGTGSISRRVPDDVLHLDDDVEPPIRPPCLPQERLPALSSHPGRNLARLRYLAKLSMGVARAGLGWAGWRIGHGAISLVRASKAAVLGFRQHKAVLLHQLVAWRASALLRLKARERQCLRIAAKDLLSPASETAAGKWQDMGESTKNMLIASALRGYPPALAFIKSVAPFIRSLPNQDERKDPHLAYEPELRCRRIQKALNRQNSRFFRLLWRFFPPLG